MAPNPPWPDLPPELLTAIANFLNPNPIDHLRFRAVCKSWLISSLSLSTNILSPLLPLSTPYPDLSLCRERYISVDYHKYLLSVTTVYAFRPPKINNKDTLSMPNTWIAFIDEFDPGKLSIRKPFTKCNFYDPLDFPKRLNLLDFEGSEIGRYYNFTVLFNDKGKLTKPRIWSEDVDKVVLSLNGSSVVVLFEKGKLGLLKLRVGNNGLDSEWQNIHDGKGFRFDDIVDYKGRLLGIDRRGRVFEMCYDSSKRDVIVPSINGGGGRRKRLIESLGMLYLVVRCIDDAAMQELDKFKVYVLSENVRKWIEVTSIGSRIFFFGHDFSFSTSPLEFKGSFGRNCIIFDERSFEKYDSRYGDSKLQRYGDSWLRSESTTLYVGVYNLEENGARIRALEHCPGYSNMVWPPPKWLWLDNK